MQKIRNKTFETNSSSSHSLVIDNGLDYLTIKHNGIISFSFSDIHDEEYGDSYTYIRPIDKLNYCVQCVYDEWPDYDDDNMSEIDYELIGPQFINRMKLIYKVVKDHTGAKKIKVNGGRDRSLCALNYYHMKGVFDSEEAVKNFIFGKNSYAKSGW